jgi:hypothetical protein
MAGQIAHVAQPARRPNAMGEHLLRVAADTGSDGLLYFYDQMVYTNLSD